MSDKPIGIFDSGVGGLTVCEAIHTRLKNENLIYFGDTGRFPYGTRSKETLIRYSQEITSYLLSRDVKMIVIACNTASAAALETIKDDLKIPVIGVIEAGARAACSRVKSNLIGVIGTKATVNSQSYKRAIGKIDPEIKVVQQQATLFVPLVEEGMTDNEIARLTIREYLQDMYDNSVRTLILGCTHFPLLKDTINGIYPDIDLVDTGVEIAYEVEEILKEKNLDNKTVNDNKVNIELYASDITETLMRLKDLFFHANGSTIEKLIING
jgi:glutamate racemase